MEVMDSVLYNWRSYINLMGAFINRINKLRNIKLIRVLFCCVVCTLPLILFCCRFSESRGNSCVVSHQILLCLSHYNGVIFCVCVCFLLILDFERYRCTYYYTVEKKISNNNIECNNRGWSYQIAIKHA